MDDACFKERSIKADRHYPFKRAVSIRAIERIYW